MAISVTGSGFDIPGTVSALVAAARAPADKRIASATTAVNAKISAIGQIKSSFSSLQTALDKLTSAASTPTYTATAQTGAGFTASAGTGASPGKYNVEVVALASAQKLASSAYASGATVGYGTLTIGYGDQSVDVQIAEGTSLTGIASAINRAAGGKGVVASVITASDGQHLVFSAADTGTANALTITASGGDGGLDSLTTAGGGLTETVAAADAVVRVDGFERTSASNSVEDLVPGVTLTLTKAAEGTTYSLDLAVDNESLKSSLSAFVTAYNSTINLLKSSSAYNSTTQTASALTGDSLVRSLQQQLRNQVSANVIDLKGLGITVDKNGVMSFDTATFDSAISSDPGAAAKLFGTDSSFGTPVGKIIGNQLDAYTGSLTLRTESLNDQLKDLQDQTSALDAKMDKLSALYTAQYTAMETMVQQLQSNGSALNGLLSQ
ncbi:MULTISPECIES: flagellar filament capping protein FliD [Gammaproteobacteria]|uniref:Flagellar hook-associated protein 2 n=1 Tax=Xanthomonas boreopolis TaxID=86183 RepID=A0A919F4D4_9XANT|nr:flagellar filament capping protein FliD [Pseudomonas sp. Hp2]GHH46371.1 flagellar hook-associated protein 2 [[Pseudomonas] boreopolis]